MPELRICLDEVPHELDAGGVLEGRLWSGLRLPDQCLVRTFSPTNQWQIIKVQAYEKVQVTLDVPPQGATYIVGRDGSVTRVQ